MLFEELYDSAMRRHHRGDGDSVEEGHPIQGRPRELRGRDAPESENELSDGGCRQRSGQIGLTPRRSVESPASKGGTDTRLHN
jgi:hypothetical protein